VRETYDIAVIGAGIAGASVAANLAQRGVRIALLEMESQPGYHTTGRSAAIYSPVYGPEPIRALTRASLGFFNTPPDGFTSNALLSVRNACFLAREDQLGDLADLQTELGDARTVTRLDQELLQSRVPLLKDGYAVAGLWDSGTSEIDVAALHQGYLRQFKLNEGTVRTNSAVKSINKTSKGWTLCTAQGEIDAAIVVNAGGAWADVLGDMAGAERIGLIPKRRTAVIVDAPEGCDISVLPLTVDVQEQFYLKPEAGKLLISPANEDPESPCDVQPDEMDIAICVDRIEQAFDISVRRIERSWAGLRSFVADKCPVAGFSAQVEGFYWLAGQGGYGIQSAPALAEYAAAKILGLEVPQHILAEGLDPATLKPNRDGLLG
jgi:D-arginine dehydrogenase